MKEIIRYLLIGGLVFSFVLPACKNVEREKAAVVSGQKYTCPMHPQIIKDVPGSCPICGMDLVPVEKNDAEVSLTLSESQKALANITTARVGSAEFASTKVLNGRLAVNPEKTEFVTSRVPGRIEQLYVRQTGVKVNKGQPLYRIYSEELATLQREYLLALDQVAHFPQDAVFRQLLQAAIQKLELYGQSKAQISRLEKIKKPDPYVTYHSPESGVVAELSVTEGQYVIEGSPLLRLESYSNLWVEADVYPAEAQVIRQGQKVKVSIPGWEGQEQTMTINFLTPALETGSQLMRIRGSVANPNNQWQPGMQANIFLPVQTKGMALSLPVDAVIRDGKGAHVWIQKNGKFEPRMVQTGVESVSNVEITEGLTGGDTVVTSGAYLLYSEYILKKGKNPMAGHQH